MEIGTMKHKLARHSTKEYLDEVTDLHKSTTKHRLAQAISKYKPQPLMLSELKKTQKLGNHMIFSMDNPKYGQHDENAHPNMLSQLKTMGADVHEAQGKYGKPERSIIVRSPAEQIKNHIISSAHANGQDSIILSNGNEHKMIYLNGPHVGMHHAGIGTEYHQQEPSDFYTKMSNGTMFSHNFDFDKLHKAGVVSPPKGMNLKQMTQIKRDNNVGANGKDYSAEELNDAIIRTKTNLAAKMKLIPPKINTTNEPLNFPPPMPMKKSGGEGSVYTLILFEGCELHDILHCSHFATDDISAYDDIKKACDEYFEKKPKSVELEFNDQGTLGKMAQPVLFLTSGDPYKDLFEQLKDVAAYKYPSFKPHISVTSNVDSFKGKVSKLVISVDGDIKASYDLSNEEPMEKATKPGVTLLGSAPHHEGIKSIIGKYWASNKIDLVPNQEGSHDVHNNGKKIDGFKVVQNKNRVRFEHHDGLNKADKKPFNSAESIAETIAQLKAHKERHAATMAQPKPQAPAQAAPVVAPQPAKPTNSSQLDNLTAPVYVNIHQHRSAVRNNVPNPVGKIQHLDDVHKLNQYHGKDVVESIGLSPNPSWGHETYRVNPDKSMHLMDSNYDSSDSKSFQRR